MIDTYTKIVLTIIAAALVMLIFQQVTPRAVAAFGDCGTSLSPCYMKLVQ